MDTVSKEKRSAIMRAIRSADTKPELFVRSVLHHAGYRYALHAKDLPGSPDIAMRSRHIAVEIRGCFWHAHEGCGKAHFPASNRAWWRAKLRRNSERDDRNAAALLATGWKLLVVWTCFFDGVSETARNRQSAVILRRLARLESGPRRFAELKRGSR